MISVVGDLKVARMAAQKEGGSTLGLVEQYLGTMVPSGSRGECEEDT